MVLGTWRIGGVCFGLCGGVILRKCEVCMGVVVYASGDGCRISGVPFDLRCRYPITRKSRF